MKNALNEITSYTYDTNGNMLTHTDGAGNVTTVQYNVRNLPVARIEPGGISGFVIDTTKTMYYTYNADGSVASEVDQNGVSALYAYDIHGRVLSKSAGGKSVSYTYDNNGNILTQADQGGVTTRTYDALNRTTSKNVPVIGLTTASGLITVTYDYDAFGNLLMEYMDDTNSDYCLRTRGLRPKTNLH